MIKAADTRIQLVRFIHPESSNIQLHCLLKCQEKDKSKAATTTCKDFNKSGQTEDHGTAEEARR